MVRGLRGHAGTAARTREPLVGNRLALAGTVLYFLEWVGIAFLPGSLPTESFGKDPAAIVADYLHSPERIALVAGWFAVALLGRVVFMAGLTSVFRRDRERALGVVAIAAMTVSVVLEVAAFAIVAAAAWIAHAHAPTSSVVSLDTAASVLDELIFGPAGVAVVVASLAMLTSRLFPRGLAWLGLVAGVLVTIGGIVASSAKGGGGGWHTFGGVLTGVPVFLFWVWMIVTAVVVFRATPRAVSAA